MGGLKKVEKGIGKIWLPVRKVIDPLNIMDPFNILPDAKLRGKKRFSFDPEYGGAAQKWLGINQGGSSSSYAPRDYSSIQKMMQADPNNQMASDLMIQKQMTDQATSSQQAQNFQAANAQQQQNINSAMQNSKQNLNNSLMRTPVPSTFSKNTPASTNQFKLPNVAGLTFRK